MMELRGALLHCRWGVLDKHDDDMDGGGTTKACVLMAVANIIAPKRMKYLAMSMLRRKLSNDVDDGMTIRVYFAEGACVF